MDNGKNKVMMIIIIVLLLVLLGTIIGVFFYTMSTIKNNNNETVSESTTAPIKNLKQEEITLVGIDGNISTNCAVGEDGRKDHVVRVSMVIGVDNTDKKLSPDMITLLQEKIPVIKSETNNLLRNKTYEELHSSEGKELLENELLENFQVLFDSNLIVSVYMQEYIVQ